ncbi:MAG: hypothetical protein KAX80_00030 [Planctomycetes bacterium]|nr:hypothetical protein [Planctomycetota bacterium]
MGVPILIWNGTALVRALGDAAGHFQIDVLSSALSTGAATSANQGTMITALQLIDDLQAALHSVNTDELVVRGEDQLFSFKGKLLDHTSNVDTAAGDIGLAATTVPAGEVWVVTSVLAINTVTVCSSIYLYAIDGADEAAFRRGDTPSITAGLSWSGHLYLEAGDRVNATFMGCALHDRIYLQTLGYKMTKEV